MREPATKNRELLNLVIVLIAVFAFSVLSVSGHFVHRLSAFLSAYSTVPIGEFLINLGFLYLSGLLWLTYLRWREAANKRTQLENIIKSISPDVFLVVDPGENIVMCNASVKRVFGYEVDEVINRKTDVLYSHKRSYQAQPHETSDMLERECFRLQFAVGRKKTGETIPLEIINGSLSGYPGAVLLVRDITERNQAEDVRRKAYEEL